METVAVYWEPKIRTYGFVLQEGLKLWEFVIPADQLPAWGQALAALQETTARFEWVTALPGKPGILTLRLVCAPEVPVPFTADPAGDLIAVSAKSLGLVDVVSFQGPHFGNRYGIADFTLEALAGRQIPLLGIACSVSGISLILAHQWGARTRDLLEAHFEIPQKKPALEANLDNSMV